MVVGSRAARGFASLGLLAVMTAATESAATSADAVTAVMTSPATGPSSAAAMGTAVMTTPLRPHVRAAGAPTVRPALATTRRRTAAARRALALHSSRKVVARDCQTVRAARNGRVSVCLDQLGAMTVAESDQLEAATTVRSLPTAQRPPAPCLAQPFVADRAASRTLSCDEQYGVLTVSRSGVGRDE